MTHRALRNERQNCYPIRYSILFLTETRSLKAKEIYNIMSKEACRRNSDTNWRIEGSRENSLARKITKATYKLWLLFFTQKNGENLDESEST